MRVGDLFIDEGDGEIMMLLGFSGGDCWKHAIFFCLFDGQKYPYTGIEVEQYLKEVIF